MRSKFRAVALLLSIAPAPHLVASGSTLSQQPGPNHYILLVDASGSAVSNRAYASACNQLVEHIFGQGFGDAIPACQLGTDRVSLYHFGIVEGEATTAYQRLSKYDLVGDLIHPCLRRSIISRDELIRLLPPDTHYRLTIQNWVKPLGLSESQTPNNIPMGRTFLVFLSDGTPNDATADDERSLVNRWGEPDSVKHANQVADDIRSRYQAELAAWSTRFTENTNSPLFLDAAEVRSLSITRWETALSDTEPLQSATWRWTGSLGPRPSAEVSVALDDQFLKRLGETPPATLEVRIAAADISGKAAWNGERRFVVPVRCKNPYHCQQKDATLVLTATFKRADPLLGTTTYDYTAHRTIDVPLPFRCSLPFYAAIALVALGVVAGIATAGYVWYFRARATKVAVRLPGWGVKPIPLSWGMAKRRATYFANQPFLMLVHLPSYRYQALIYRGASLTIEPDSAGSVVWDAGGSQVVLPHHQFQLQVRLASTGRPQAPLPRFVKLTLRYRGRTASIELGDTQDSPFAADF